MCDLKEDIRFRVLFCLVIDFSYGNLSTDYQKEFQVLKQFWYILTQNKKNERIFQKHATQKTPQKLPQTPQTPKKQSPKQPPSPPNPYPALHWHFHRVQPPPLDKNCPPPTELPWLLQYLHRLAWEFPTCLPLTKLPIGLDLLD